MDLSVVAAVFPLVFLGELPDKTMFASLVMASRGRPGAVWLGAAGAFAVHVVIATTVGVGVFALLPHWAVDAFVALLFAAGAAWSVHEARSGDEVEVIDREVAAHRVVPAAFVVIFIAEWGDLTQILTATLAARYHSPLNVGIAAVAALWSVAAIAVIGGQNLLRFVSVRTLRWITAAVLTALALYSTWNAFHN